MSRDAESIGSSGPAAPADGAPTHRAPVLCVVGTRPEAVKLAPVIAALDAHPTLRPRVLFTGQHRELLAQGAAVFGIRPDHDLQVMRPGQSLAGLTARLMEGLDAALDLELGAPGGPPVAVLVQGDTTTALCGALAAFYRRIPVGHVEAGLRTDDLGHPFPEEANRRLVGRLARWHFAPTDGAAARLRAEGVPAERVHRTGNTVVDAMQALEAGRLPAVDMLVPGLGERRLVLVTLHRRESFGAPLRGLLGAIADLCRAYPEVHFAYPVHPNPEVQGPAHALLGGVPNATLLPPLDYPAFLALLRRAELALTDSGGVLEEAPSFGVPVLVLRETTERPEGVAAGVARLIGTEGARLYAEADALLTDPAARAAMRGPENPYGDGKAARRIVDVLAREG